MLSQTISLNTNEEDNFHDCQISPTLTLADVIALGGNGSKGEPTLANDVEMNLIDLVTKVREQYLGPTTTTLQTLPYNPQKIQGVEVSNDPAPRSQQQTISPLADLTTTRSGGAMVPDICDNRMTAAIHRRGDNQVESITMATIPYQVHI